MAIVYIILALLVMLELSPIIMMLRVSMLPKKDVFSLPQSFWSELTLEHYIYVIERTRFLELLKNSVINATATTAFAMILGIPAAFVLAKYRFARSEGVLMLLLGSRMGPPVAFGVPVFEMFLRLRLIDTRIALILVCMLANLAFVIWLLYGFFRETDASVEEAAMLDGLNEWGVLTRISLPVVLPGVIAAATMVFIMSWNEFFYSLILTRNEASTVPVLIPSFFGAFAIDWGGMFAACLLSSLVPILFGIAVRRFLVRGFTMGALR